jgi:hypothetical protein
MLNRAYHTYLKRDNKKGGNNGERKGNDNGEGNGIDG